MTADPLASYRAGRLGRVPAFAPRNDPAHLLAAVADALNACERYGLIVDLEHGAVLTVRGYILPVGDGRLGSRWQVRAKLPVGGEFCLEGSEED
jgi:hypothetical protein